MVRYLEQAEKPIRVLHILTGLSSGGAEAFIMNAYRNMDRTKVRFDFLLRSSENRYREELENMGSRVYYMPEWPRCFAKNMLQTSRFFQEHHYSIVHIHANALLYVYALKCAKKSGVPYRIVHSHNTAMLYTWLLPLHRMNRKKVSKWATDMLACSEDAGKWMFCDPYTIFHNAIDLAAFQYDEKKRKALREQLGIREDEFVVGHIGRFLKQKNHEFLVDIFHELVRKKDNSRLVLIGEGPLREKIVKKIQGLGLEDCVLFLGERKDVANVINLFDFFVFPSTYEGLPHVLIEAQANGLPVVCSDVIPDQAILDPATNKLPLSASAQQWANVILKRDTMRREFTTQLRVAGYDITEEASRLQAFYQSRASAEMEGSV